MEPDDESPEELADLIARSDAIIADAGVDPDDPEVRLAVAVAYLARARALGQLRRFQESLEDCDRFLTRWSELFPNPTGRQRLRLLAVLGIKRDALRFVGRREESLLLGAEIIERFGEDSDPQVRTLVGLGMARRAETLLARADGVAEALVVSDELLARFDDESGDSLAGFAELLLAHARNLMAIYTSAPLLIAGLSAETVINTGTVAAQSVIAAVSSSVSTTSTRRLEGLAGAVGRLTPRVEGLVDSVGRLAPRMDGLLDSVGRLTPRMMVRHRRRITQAIVVADAVRARFADYDDPELRALEARARILTASGTAVLGHPLAGGRAMNAFEASGDAGAVQAFSDMADSDVRSAHLLNQITAVAFLRMRAMALVGEDPKLARIAFDDSVTARLPARLSPVVRAFVRVMRPNVPRGEVGPGDDADAETIDLS